LKLHAFFVHVLFPAAPILEQNVNASTAKTVLEKRILCIDVMPERMVGWGDAPIREQNVNTSSVCCTAAKCADFSMS